MQFFDDKPQEFILSNGVTAGYKAYKNRIHLWRGSHDSRERDCYLPWWSIANHIKGMILMHPWDESLFPTEQEQIERIKAQGEKKLYLPQEAIDYVLGAGSSFSEGKLRIYRQFGKNETEKALYKTVILFPCGYKFQYFFYKPQSSHNTPLLCYTLHTRLRG